MREQATTRLQRCERCARTFPLAAVRRFYPDPTSRAGGRSLDVLCALRELAAGRIADRGSNLERIAAQLGRILNARRLSTGERPLADRLRPAILEASAALVARDLLGGGHE